MTEGSYVQAEPFRTPRLDAIPLHVDAAEMAAVLADPALRTFIGGAPASRPPSGHATNVSWPPPPTRTSAGTTGCCGCARRSG